MTTRNDDLIARRKAALASKSKSVPATLVDDPEAFDEPDEPSVQPIKRPLPGGVNATTSDGSSTRSISLPMEADPTRTLDSDDLVMPQLKICQAMSKVSRSGIPQGHYYHSTLEEDLGATVLVVPVDMRKSRSVFKTGVGVTCRSYDLRQGEGDPGILCEGTPEEIRLLPKTDRGCPLRLWGERDKATGRSERPACGVNYNFPVLILDRDDPENGPTKRAIISFRGTGAKAAKAINSMVSEQDLLWHEAMIELSTEEATNFKGTFFVPTAKFMGIAKGMTATKAKRFADTFNPAAVKATEDSDDE